MPIDWKNVQKTKTTPVAKSPKTSGAIDWKAIAGAQKPQPQTVSYTQEQPKVTAGSVAKEVPQAALKVLRGVLGFGKNVAKETVKPFAKAGVTTTKALGSISALGGAGIAKALGKDLVAQRIIARENESARKPVNVPGVGAVAPITTPRESIGTGLQIGATLFGPKGTGALSKATEVGVGGAVTGGAFGLGTGLADKNKSAKQVALETAIGALTGGLLEKGGSVLAKKIKAQKTIQTADKTIGKTTGKYAESPATIKREFLADLGDAPKNAGTPTTGQYAGMQIINQDGSLNPTLASARVSDIATKLESIKPGDGVKFAQSVGSNWAPNMSTVDVRVGKVTPEALTKAIDSFDNPVPQLLEAIKGAGKASKEQAAMLSKERSQRLGQYLNIVKNSKSAGDMKRALGALKGEYTKNPDFAPLNVAKDFEDKVYGLVRESGKIQGFEKATATTALNKIFGKTGGQVPTQSELSVLKKEFGEEFTSELLKKQPLLTKFYNTTLGVLNTPRSLMASADVSASFRQALALAPSHPIKFAKAFGNQFKYLFSEKAFQNRQADLVKSPFYELAKNSKLALSTLDDNISGREERFASGLAETLTGGKFSPVRASGRAYTGLLNDFRFGVFESLADKAKRQGVDFAANPKAAESLASFINTFTGRGGLGVLEKAAVPLNAIFFSPRLMASRINTLNPIYYMRLEPFARKEAIKSLLAFGATATGLLSVAKAGLKNIPNSGVGSDPRSADFGKIKIGNTRVDILGGFQQYIRLGAQLGSGQLVSSTTGKVTTLGEGHDPLTRKDILQRFLESKEAPIPSLISTMMSGQDITGQPTNVKNEIFSRLYPMIIQDTQEAIREWGAKGAITAPLAALGIGTQTYGGPKTQTYEYINQQKIPKEQKIEVTNILKESDVLPTTPSSTFEKNGEYKNVPKKDLDAYRKDIGDATVKAILQAPKTPGWGQMTQEQKNKKVKSLISSARERARNIWKEKYFQTP